MPKFKVKKFFQTQARVYRKGEVIEVDEITARSLRHNGVIGKPIEQTGPSETQTSGPGETPETSGLRSRAREALENDDYNAMRSVLSDIDELDAPRKKDDCIEALEGYLA
jgi:hypothetical protein